MYAPYALGAWQDWVAVPVFSLRSSNPQPQLVPTLDSGSELDWKAMISYYITSDYAQRVSFPGIIAIDS